jgi:phage terminase small subunit
MSSHYTPDDLDRLINTIREWDEPGSTSRPDWNSPTEQWRSLAKAIFESDWLKEHDRWLLATYNDHADDIRLVADS